MGGKVQWAGSGYLCEGKRRVQGRDKEETGKGICGTESSSGRFRGKGGAEQAEGTQKSEEDLKHRGKAKNR